MLINILRINEQNCGDMSSSPMPYFDLPSPSKKTCIVNIMDFTKNPNDWVIFGGGGLFYENKKASWTQKIASFVESHYGPKIIWGAGSNIHQAGNQTSHDAELLKKFDLVGIRDYGLGHRWVPCASCMSPLFDKNYEIKYDIGVYDHAEMPIFTTFPKCTNNTSMEKAINFLGSCNYVVTNTYHGAYWATLLKKKVIVLPLENSSRFFFMRHKPVLVENLNDFDFTSAVKYESALGDCRVANIEFYKDFMKLIRKHII